jgi:hypothetical protein
MKNYGLGRLARVWKINNTKANMRAGTSLFFKGDVVKSPRRNLYSKNFPLFTVVAILWESELLTHIQTFIHFL